MNIRFAAAAAIAAAVITVPVTYRFLSRWAFERRINKKIIDFSNHDLVLEEVVEHARLPEGDETPEGQIRGWKRQTPKMRVNLSQVLADEAYLQFGRRARSQANDLVTRKWMRDFLHEYKGLRAKDASRVIELALSLSYLPPEEFWEIRAAEQTYAYGRRVPRAGPQTP
jgi:hypothetical protein